MAFGENPRPREACRRRSRKRGGLKIQHTSQGHCVRVGRRIQDFPDADVGHFIIVSACDDTLDLVANDSYVVSVA